MPLVLMPKGAHGRAFGPSPGTTRMRRTGINVPVDGVSGAASVQAVRMSPTGGHSDSCNHLG